ncbi:hypothetical protein RB608_11830 [Nocardioides sp. LHD-245]|uniref:hypothetical protein n=1 Tax=Nocardioides sp. LHD-245 TaxID=3051387 RepID=UPI0027DEF2F9|nr:hypothetical protein [Nocardioides sp. LHD-245]
MSAEIALLLAGIAATCWAWLHGYHSGVTAMRRSAVEALLTSARLRRALSTDPSTLRVADAFEMAAFRIELMPDPRSDR